MGREPQEEPRGGGPGRVGGRGLDKVSVMKAGGANRVVVTRLLFTGGELGADLSSAEVESLWLPGFSKGPERDESRERTESGPKPR